ncbi:MAG: succinate dehydrogenase, cytochrome b556 subunit [Pseudomonadota bacterium]
MNEKKSSTRLSWYQAVAVGLQYLLPQMRAYKPKAAYRWHPGFVAWVLHRLGGLGLVAYIFLHLYVLSSLADGPAFFNRIMALFDHPLIKIMEIGLLGVVVYHSVNGLRIVFMDYGPMAEKETHLKYVAGTFIVIGAMIVAGGLWMFLKALGF